MPDPESPPAGDAAPEAEAEALSPEIDIETLIDMKSLPRELGFMLMSAGVVGFILPGPGTPAIIAGGIILWPKGFGRVEGWVQRRLPSLHSGGMHHLRRFLKDLEKRYPGSIRRA